MSAFASTITSSRVYKYALNSSRCATSARCQVGNTLNITVKTPSGSATNVIDKVRIGLVEGIDGSKPGYSYISTPTPVTGGYSSVSITGLSEGKIWVGIQYHYKQYTSNRVYLSEGWANWCRCEVTIYAKHVTQIKFNQANLQMTVGDTQQLSVAVTPSDATNPGVSYRSADDSIAVVKSNGEVTAVGAGNTLIYAFSDDNPEIVDVCPVTVVEPIIHTHSYSDKITKAVTCTTSGIRTYTCSCGESYEEEIPATGHIGDTEIRNQKEATEEEEGYTGDIYCKNCGEKLKDGEVIPKLQPIHRHSYESMIEKEVTCTEAGLRRYICECGDQFTEEIPVSGHIGKTDIRNRREATEYQEGYTGDIYCQTCGGKLHDGEYIPKLQTTHRHSYRISIEKEAGYTETGIRRYTCECGESYTEEIPVKIQAAETNTMIEKQTEPDLQNEKTETPGISTSETEIDKDSVTTVRKGTTVAISGLKYKVTSSSNKKTREVSLVSGSAQRTVKIPSSVRIGEYNYKVTSIADRAFYKNKKLAMLTIPNTVRTIGVSAFYGCTNLKRVNGAANIQILKKKAFYGCIKLSSIGKLKNLKIVGEYAFTKCKSLKNFVSGKKLQSIGKSAFSGCLKLKTISLSTAKLKLVGKKAFFGINKTAKIKVPSASLKKYEKLLKNKGQRKTVKLVKIS